MTEESLVQYRVSMHARRVVMGMRWQKASKTSQETAIEHALHRNNQLLPSNAGRAPQMLWNQYNIPALRASRCRRPSKISSSSFLARSTSSRSLLSPISFIRRRKSFTSSEPSEEFGVVMMACGRCRPSRSLIQPSHLLMKLH